jgi:hypothetical protein
MKRSSRLRVIAEQADHDISLSFGRAKPRVGDLPKYPSPEIARDATIPAEPPGLAEVPLDDSRRKRWRVYRDARVLAGTAPDPAPTPRTRGECPPDRHERGCGSYRCRFHLWVSPPCGRPGLSAVPRHAASGYTLRVLGKFGSAEGRLQLDARWLEGGPMPASCALDIADAGPHSPQQIGDATDRHRTLALREIKAALRSLICKGVRAEDLRRLVEPDREPTEPSRAQTRGSRRGLR